MKMSQLTEGKKAKKIEKKRVKVISAVVAFWVLFGWLAI